MPVIRRLRTLLAAFLIAALPLQGQSAALMSCHKSQTEKATVAHPAINHIVVGNHAHGQPVARHHHGPHHAHESLSTDIANHFANAENLHATTANDSEDLQVTTANSCAACSACCALSSVAVDSPTDRIFASASIAPEGITPQGHSDADLRRFLRPPR